MPPTGKLEFPSGRPRLYTFALSITACTFIANLLIWYLIPRYWSVTIPDKAHPDTIRFNGAVIHVSSISHRLFTGSFIAALVAIFALVGLGFYYRSIGIAMPPLPRDDITPLNLRDR
jgi:hypothetical protein